VVAVAVGLVGQVGRVVVGLVGLVVVDQVGQVVVDQVGLVVVGQVVVCWAMTSTVLTLAMQL